MLESSPRRKTYDDIRRDSYVKDLRVTNSLPLDWRQWSTDDLETLRDSEHHKYTILNMAENFKVRDEDLSLPTKQLENVLYDKLGGDIYEYYEGHQPYEKTVVIDSGERRNQTFGVEDIFWVILKDLDFESLVSLYDSGGETKYNMNSPGVLNSISRKWELPLGIPSFEELIQKHDKVYASKRCPYGFEKCLEMASKEGNLEIVKWTISKSREDEGRYSEEDLIAAKVNAEEWKLVAKYSSQAGKSDLRDYALSRLRLDWKYLSFRPFIEDAAWYGDLEFIKSVYRDERKRVHLGEWIDALYAAVPNDNLEVFVYILKIVDDFDNSMIKPINEKVGENSSLQILDEMIELELIEWKYVIRGAVRAGNLEMIQEVEFMGEYDFKWWSVAEEAAYPGHLEIIQYAETKTEDIDWNKIAQAAAYSGHLDILQYADMKTEDIDWKEIAQPDSYNGHLDILQYAETKTEDIDWNKIIEFAARNGHLGILQYAETKTEDIDWIWIFGMAAYRLRFNIMIYILDGMYMDRRTIAEFIDDNRLKYHVRNYIKHYLDSTGRAEV